MAEPRFPWLEVTAAIAVAAIAAVVIFVASEPHGPHVSTDSVFYLSTADSLRSGDGPIAHDGNPLTTFPPGFPVTVAAAGEVAGGTLLGARILNSLCLALAVAMGWLLLRRHVRSRALRIAGAAGVASAPALFSISSAAWSEPLFVALVLATVLALERSLEPARSWRWIVATGALGGLAFSVRYVGLWLPAAGAIALLVPAGTPASLGRRARQAALLVLAGSVVPALVVGRNLRLIHGHPLGDHGESATSFGQNLTDAMEGIARWFAPATSASWLPVELLVASLAAAAAWALSRRTPSRPPRSRAPLWPLGLVVVLFAVFLVASASSAYLDPIGPRLMSPGFVPATVLAFAGLDRLPQTRLACAAIVGAVVMWLAAQAQVTGSGVRALRHDGAGYTDARWRSSALISLLRRRGLRPAFSNYTDALYFHTRVAAGCWPSLNPTGCGNRGPSPTRIRAAGPTYLAWFSEPRRTGPYVPPALEPFLRLTESARVADGRLYRVSFVRPRTARRAGAPGRRP